ncbi:MAG: endonuclease/exonuclease/phosphatase family protein [Parachlamydiales bacterium]
MFTVTTYNILCKNYAFQARYPTIDPEILQWANRKEALTEKISSLDSDLFCLQEVSPGFCDHLKRLTQYERLYLAPQKGPQSLLILYRRGKLKLLHHNSLYFERSGSGEGRWRPAQIAHFEIEGIEIGVINTHLCFDEVGEIAQVEIEELLREVVGPSGIERWILCGDFNIVPSSGGIRALREAGFRYTSEGAEQVTCSIEGFAETVDYICYTAKTMGAVHHPSTEVREMAALPRAGEPSDHLPVTGTLGFL